MMIEELFTEQLLGEPKIITEEILEKIEGTTVLGKEYEVGDQVLHFLEVVRAPSNPAEVELQMQPVCLTELEELGNLYKISKLGDVIGETGGMFPVLEKIG